MASRAGVVAAAWLGLCAGHASLKPHLVIALVDDLGWNGLNFTGHNSEVITPRTAALARDGVVLTAH
jgi:arylsulfatase A-like enzyme